MSSDFEEFWNLADTSSGEDSCWPWLGSYYPTGYGRFDRVARPTRTRLASRISFFLSRRYEPFGLSVCHTCDNPACVNPRHLYAGTQEDNIRDMMERGRHRSHGLKGEQMYNSRLTEEAVRAIRRVYVPRSRGVGYGNAGVLAERYGVSPSLIGKVARRRAWAWVPEEESLSAGADTVKKAMGL